MGQEGTQETLPESPGTAGSLFLGPSPAAGALRAQAHAFPDVLSRSLAASSRAHRDATGWAPTTQAGDTGQQAAQPTIPRPARTGSPRCLCQPPPPPSRGIRSNPRTKAAGPAQASFLVSPSPSPSPGPAPQHRTPGRQYWNPFTCPASWIHWGAALGRQTEFSQGHPRRG